MTIKEDMIPRQVTCPKRQGGCGRKTHINTLCEFDWCERRGLCLTCDISRYGNHTNTLEIKANIKAHERGLNDNTN
jgi:hypothetical protein